MSEPVAIDARAYYVFMNKEQNGLELPLPKLLPGEELISVETVQDTLPDRAPSGLKELQRLANAPSRAEIGDFGPVLASLSIETHQDQPEFHRYEAIFGRDSLRVALDLIEEYPKLARSTLLTLAIMQGVEANAEREEEPGRIIHEARDPSADPLARELTQLRGWGWPYYGSVDSTPEFIRTLAAYCRQTKEGAAFLEQRFVGRDNAERTMAQALEAAVGWIMARLAANPEGLLEFKTTIPGGITNQAWKDSPDSYFHENGEFANHERGIASVEVQRVAYDALCDAAYILETHLDKPRVAHDSAAAADRLKASIMERFWTDERGGFFVLGTDRDSRGRLRQLKIKTSNMGHLLHSRLLDGDDPEIVRRREAVVAQLFSPAMLCLNGIRTLSAEEVRFRPGAYHNGSVWIWDNYLISQGLARHGYEQQAVELNERLLSDIRATRRFPEYLRGDDDKTHRLNTRTVKIWDKKNNFENTLEQPPQDIQAWSAAAILAIKLKRRRHKALVGSGAGGA